MKAMILAAGVGSRLFPLTDKLPKPMLPIANKPALEHLVELCKTHNIYDIRMNLHYLPEEIDTYFGNGSDFGVSISYSLEKNLMGTAGAVKRSSHFLNETFVVLSGDGFTDIDITEMYNRHKASGSKLTIAVKEVEDPTKFGVVVTDADGKITGFQEKPAKEEALSNLVNLGIYIIEPEVLAEIPRKEAYDFGYQLFPKLVSMGFPMYSYTTNARWTDIGDLKEYRSLNLALAKHIMKTDNAQVIGKDTYIHPSAVIKGSCVIGDNVSIEKGAVIEDSVILNNTKIGKNVDITNSIVFENFVINIDRDFGLYVDDENVIAARSEKSLKQKSLDFIINVFDRVASFTALVFLTPLFLLVALLIKIDSPGPVFYVSKRVMSPGYKKSGKKWSIIKAGKTVRYIVFRTMYVDADKKIGTLNNKYATGPFIKIENDPRVTRVGNILRKTSIDELPLLFSVLRGDMSLVGIWALPVYEAESLLVNGLKTSSENSEFDLSEMARVRFKGKAGLAGYWQSKGRSKLSAEERAIHDSFQAAQYYYHSRFSSSMGKFARHSTIRGYIRALIDTFVSVIKRSGAM